MPPAVTSMRGVGSVTEARVAVEWVAAATDGSARAARTSPRLVSMPSTRVRASAESRVANASARSAPRATTFASIGSYAVVTSVPVSIQESTRTAGMSEGKATWVNSPALGRCSRVGSSA